MSGEGGGRSSRIAVDQDGGAARTQLVRPPEPRFFDQATAAAYFGISERAFEVQWRSDQMPSPRKIGRRLVWDRKLLDRWADLLSGLA